MKYFHEQFEEIKSHENPFSIYFINRKYRIDNDDFEDTNFREVRKTFIKVSTLLIDGLYTVFS